MLILLATGPSTSSAGVLRERISEATALHLAIAHLAEQRREPFEFVLDAGDRRAVEQLAEHPQCAAQASDCHPGVVDRVTAPTKAQITDEDFVDLRDQVVRDSLAALCHRRCAGLRLCAVNPREFGWIPGRLSARALGQPVD